MSKLARFTSVCVVQQVRWMTGDTRGAAASAPFCAAEIFQHCTFLWEMRLHHVLVWHVQKQLISPPPAHMHKSGKVSQVTLPPRPAMSSRLLSDVVIPASSMFGAAAPSIAGPVIETLIIKA